MRERRFSRREVLWSIAGFYLEAGENGRGFLVENQEVDFFNVYQSLGGIQIFGYPISNKYQDRGVWFQYFQRLALWAPANKAQPFPLLMALHDGGWDDRLFQDMQIPVFDGFLPKAALPKELRSFYDYYGGEQVFGKPTSKALDLKTFIIQRFENTALQLWPNGLVTPVNLGDYVKKQGLLPKEATRGEIGQIQVPQVTLHGDLDLPYVYFTFDDFWQPDSLEILLNVAQAHDIKLTLFPVGTSLKARPDLFRRAAAEGHSIQNHTQTHPRLNELTESEIYWQIKTQQETLKAVLGDLYVPQKWLRPPFGSGIFDRYDPRLVNICENLGLKIAMWSIDSKGYIFNTRTDPDALKITAANIETSLGKGSIVLQHPVPTDLTVFPQMVERAKAQGLFAISMSQGMK